MTLTPAVVEISILKGMTLKTNEHTQKPENSLKCQVFWAGFASFGQVGLISDPSINF